MNAVGRPWPSLRSASGQLRSGPFLALLAGLLLAVNLAAVGIGAVPVGWRELLALPGNPLGLEADVSEQARGVLLFVRLPRIVLALLAGAGLAVSGAALQALFRNPLADPGLLGISSGAALGAGLMIVAAPAGFAAGLHGLAVPLAAFLGALAATAAVLALAGRQARWAPSATLLAGIAVNALAGAGIGLLSYLADDAALRNFTFWTLGSLAGAAWPVLSPVALLTVPALWLLLREAAALNLLLLGESEAGHLGLDVRRLKRRVIALSALAVGALVAVTGIIGFLGLVAPHLVRLSIGPDHRALLPGSALAGALLLGAADLGARTLAAPAELPIGLLTALLGGPFFLWLLRRQEIGPEAG
jgi:iron complex transport system permease protein